MGVFVVLNRAGSLAASISVTSCKPEEFKITDAMFKAFRDFVAADPAFKVTAAMVDRNRAFHRAANCASIS